MAKKKIGVREQKAIELFKKATKGMPGLGEIDSWFDLPFVAIARDGGFTNCWSVESTGYHKADWKLGVYFAEHHIAHYRKELAKGPMEMSPLPLGFVVRDMGLYARQNCSIQTGYLWKLAMLAIKGLEEADK